MKKIEIKPELPQSVNNLIEKPAATLGEKISDLLEIIFGGITYHRKKLEAKREANLKAFIESLEKNVSAIPQDKKCEPQESIIGPALEAAKYRIDTAEIRNMFANLIASSLNSDRRDYAHPCFVEILKNISADDAKALETLSLVRDRCLCPVVTMPDNFFTIPNRTAHYCMLVDDFGFEKSNLIISSLLRNGLIEFRYITPKMDMFQKAYDLFTDKMDEELKLKNVPNREEEVPYKYGILALTVLGYEFAKTCSPMTIDDLREIVKEYYE